MDNKTKSRITQRTQPQDQNHLETPMIRIRQIPEIKMRISSKVQRSRPVSDKDAKDHDQDHRDPRDKDQDPLETPNIKTSIRTKPQTCLKWIEWLNFAVFQEVARSVACSSIQLKYDFYIAMQPVYVCCTADGFPYIFLPLINFLLSVIEISVHHFCINASQTTYLRCRDLFVRQIISQ